MIEGVGVGLFNCDEKKNSFLNLLSLKGLNMHFMYNERFLKLFLIFDIVLFKMFYEN